MENQTDSNIFVDLTEINNSENFTENQMTNNSLDYNYNHTYCSAEYAIFTQKLDLFVLNLNLIICVFGVCANIINVIIFSRKKMINPTNAILASISTADLLVMAAYIPQYFAKLDYSQQNPYVVAVIWIIHEYFLSVFHPVSIWLNTTLAMFRLIAVIHPLKSRSLCTMRRAKIIILSILIFNIIICIPGYLAVSIVEADETKSWREGGCSSEFCAKWTSFNVLRKIEFLYQGLISKVVPSIILTYVSIRLILALLRAHNERKKMMMAIAAEEEGVHKNGAGDKENCSSSSQKKDLATLESKRDFDRTTRMLLVVLLVFLMTELPPGTVHILEVFHGPIYYFECRRPIHYLILGMYFMSGALNFPVYVIMSKNYRETLMELFGIRKVGKQVIRNQSKDSTASAASSTGSQSSARTQDSSV